MAEYELTTYEKIMGIVSEPMGWVLSFLYDFIGNYGITLIVFTIIVRAALFPLYAKQIRYSAKMKEFQPKMQELQRKYANDKETMNMKMMELYKTEKFNPMSGCLPMLIQFPIICGLFVLLRNPMAFMDSPRMVMAVHEAFLWLPDLSQPDSWILPILAGLGTYATFMLTQAQTMNMPGGQGQGMMKVMKYFFPVMIVWMGRSFPAGLTLYWVVGNIFMVLQTLLTANYRKKMMGIEKAPKKAKAKKQSA
ncbi:MAG: YidC/Oxa1 family membrane protein insertase [Bacillota bacterium]|nr:YidC/Oxa1 family membrane protein insertase [Bacillota bacterium]